MGIKELQNGAGTQFGGGQKFTGGTEYKQMSATEGKAKAIPSIGKTKTGAFSAKDQK